MSTSKSKPTPMKAPKRSNYFIPQPMKDGLAELAQRREVSEAALVRQAVGTMLKQNKIAF